MIKFGVALQKVFQVAACSKVNLPRRGLDARNMRMVLGVSPILSTHTRTHSLMNLIARADLRVYDSWSTLSKDRTPLAIQSQTTKTCDTLFV